MRRVLWIAGGLLLLIPLAAAATLLPWLDGQILPYPQSGALMVERATPIRTGAACSDASCLAERAPIAAYAEYRRCGGYSESARAGEGRLACSVGWATDWLLKRSGVEGQSLYRQYRRACRTHDLCYIHATATYDPAADPQEARSRCDRMFLADILRDCAMMSGSDARAYRFCRWRAMAAYSSVRLAGRELLQKGAATCDYEPGPHAPRDQVVSGRFLPNGPEQVVTLVQDRGLATLSVQLHGFAADGTASVRASLELAPGRVEVADREQACQRLREPGGALGAKCPQTLAATLIASADWLRFPAIVIDSDGDGVDEIVLPTLTRDFGLAFTHLRIDGSGPAPTFAPPKAYLSVHRPRNYVPDASGAAPGNCETELELADCSEPGAGGDRAVLSHELATQLAAHNFVVVQAPTENCDPLPETGPQELVLLGGYGEAPGQISHRLHRFYFDAPLQRWVMRRDKFTEDRHRMRYCDREEVGLFQQASRLQFPALSVRGPVDCMRREAGKSTRTTVMQETLTAIVREKCPSSVIRSRAGELNDIDLVSYPLNRGYAETDDALGDSRDEPQIGRATWIPMIWNEAADPAMTSRAARRAKVAMVGVYMGGTPKLVPRWWSTRSWRSGAPAKGSDDRNYPLVSVMRLDERVWRAAKPAWMERQPDTVGLPPAQYALLQSNKTASRQTWPRSVFGDPAMFFDLPSVLAPFDINGRPGLALVMFANHDTATRRPISLGEGAVLKPGFVQIMIAPLEGGSDLVRLLECPVPSAEGSADGPVRIAAWPREFLQREPALPGMFFVNDGNQERGGLAVAWRRGTQGLGFTSFRFAHRRWWLGPQMCADLSTGPAKKGDLWMMKLN